MKKIILFQFLIMFSLALLAQVHIIRQESFSFNPNEIEVNVGDTIRWEWTGGSHTTTSLEIPEGAAAWDSPLNSTNTFFEYKVLTEGTYNFKCTPHQAMGMTGSFTAVLPLTSNNISVSRILVYPNPANEFLFIETETTELLSLIVFNSVGQIVVDFRISNSSTIDVSLLGPGYYYYQIKNENNSLNIADRFVKL